MRALFAELLAHHEGRLQQLQGTVEAKVLELENGLVKIGEFTELANKKADWLNEQLSSVQGKVVAQQEQLVGQMKAELVEATNAGKTELKVFEEVVKTWATGFQSKVDKQVREALDKTGTGNMGGEKMGRRKLNDAKSENLVGIAKDCSKADFIHWIKCLELHLENVPGWRHATKVLQKARLRKEVVDETVFD